MGSLPPLPTLGLGLSSNAQREDVPAPYRLLERHPGAFDYLEYSAPLDVEQARREASLFPDMEARRQQVPLVYHPVHLNLFGPELEPPHHLALAARHVEAVGSPWISNDVGWWHHRGMPLPGHLYLAPGLTVEDLSAAVAHVRHVQDAMPVPVLVENPVELRRSPGLHALDFMARLSEATGCWMLLDVGHLVSSQLVNGRGLEEGLEGFPLDRVAQLHVAGGVVSQGGFYADDHPQPVRDEVWALVERIAPRCTALRALTYEADGHPEPVAWRNLARLRRLAPGAGAGPSGGPSSSLPPGGGGRSLAPVSTGDGGAPRPPTGSAGVPLAPAPGVDPRRAWELFREAHRRPGPEQDLRLAVLAQAIDAVVPLTRLAVAPTFPRLRAFMAGEAFEAWFEEASRPLPEAFVTWAMAEARRWPGAEALVSLELWARTRWARRGDATAVEGVFPADLTEAVHAAATLGRHLGGRGLLDDEAGWDGLLQCARRAGPGPWRVLVSARGAAVQVTPRE